MNKKSKTKKKILIIGIIISVLIWLIYCLLLFFLWSHRNGTKYNDFWIMGKTAEQIEEKYGEFDYEFKNQDGHIYKTAYEVRIGGCRVFRDGHYVLYLITFNEQGKAKQTDNVTSGDVFPGG